ncbi:hypothetical protein QR680_013080 [Steinernema hermaphroditum]|uniref:Uncharacterized protein n=1 Tax=Steinernema hermaphroditum TaxID=289476 RepID=A0AA39I4B3_9BILA|nr:hypothetical protein QR680_013080 [Steinernema hermaphroditum]
MRCLLLELLLLLCAVEALVYRALFVPSVRLLNKACSEVEQLVVDGGSPTLRDAHTCADGEKNQHSVFVNSAPPKFVLDESFGARTIRISVEDTKGQVHHGSFNLSKEFSESLRDLRVKLKGETSPSLIEAEVRAGIVLFATEELTFLASLLRSSLMGVAVAFSMVSAFAVFSAIRERLRRKVYLDDIRTPMTLEERRWRHETTPEYLVAGENESEDLLYERPNFADRLIEFE